jgi:hypothetical protein
MSTSRSLRIVLAASLAAFGAVGAVGAASASSNALNTTFTFDMARSAGVVAANCLQDAAASVRLVNHGETETMTVTATGLVPNSEYDLFVIQVPDAPFGIAWYQGDLQSDGTGAAHHSYVGRFSIETFAVAPGSAAAPVIHTGVDASSNPAFAPIHMFHLGLWFGSPSVATAAGCPSTVTPFNGDHNAGIQAMSTRNFPNLRGPLRHLQP